MASITPIRLPRRVAWLVLAALSACSIALASPVRALASVTTIGSPLSVSATKDTANDLAYSGANVMLPGSIFHIPHDGADTALWNTQSSGEGPAVPAAGQITSVRLKGCARQPSGAPAPLTQIHFQDLVPQSDGSVKVSVSTQPFEIPVCGQNGASGSTVTTYAPTNFCVAQGDYVDFNDEGGFVPSNTGPPPYPAGVPYLVIGEVPGSTVTSFIRNNGVGNGATFSPGDITYHDGFVANQGQEVLLQETLATGSDASPLCHGGTRGVHVPTAVELAPIRLLAQTDGVNHSSVVAVAIYCQQHTPCAGTATLTAPGRQARKASYGSSSFGIPGRKTSHVPIHVGQQVVALLRAHRSGIPVTLTVVVGGSAFAQTIRLRIY